MKEERLLTIALAFALSAVVSFLVALVYVLS